MEALNLSLSDSVCFWSDVLKNLWDFLNRSIFILEFCLSIYELGLYVKKLRNIYVETKLHSNLDPVRHSLTVRCDPNSFEGSKIIHRPKLR